MLGNILDLICENNADLCFIVSFTRESMANSWSQSWLDNRSFSSEKTCCFFFFLFYSSLLLFLLRHEKETRLIQCQPEQHTVCCCTGNWRHNLPITPSLKALFLFFDDCSCPLMLCFLSFLSLLLPSSLSRTDNVLGIKYTVLGLL